MVMAALRANGHLGIVKAINAHGNLANIPLHAQQALQRKGVNLISVPVGRKEAADKAILVDMLFFAMVGSICEEDDTYIIITTARTTCAVLQEKIKVETVIM